MVSGKIGNNDLLSTCNIDFYVNMRECNSMTGINDMKTIQECGPVSILG